MQLVTLQHLTNCERFLSSAIDLMCFDCRKQVYDSLQAKVDVLGLNFLEEYRRKVGEMESELGQIVREIEELNALTHDANLQFANFLREAQFLWKAQMEELKKRKKQLICLYRSSFEVLIQLSFQPFVLSIPSLPVSPSPVQNPLQPRISTANAQVVSIDSPDPHYYLSLYLSEQLRGVNKGTAHTVLSGEGDRVICIGGNQSNLCYLLTGKEKQWEVESLQPMKASRGSFGLVEFEGWVLAIGGWGEKQALQACEKLSVLENIQENAWKSISDLKKPHYEVNPCIYARQIYVCGGHSSYIEVYNPDRDQFSLISANLRSSCPSISLVFEGQLLILIGEETLRLSPGSTVSTDWKRPNYVHWSQSPPLVYEDKIYIVEKGSLKVLVLPDGRSRDVEYCAQLLD